MSYIKEKVAYLRGLAEGMEIGADAQGKLINAMIAAMDAMADAIDENETAITELDECIDDIYGELDAIDACCFDEDDYEDGDDAFEMECPACGETVCFDLDILESEGELSCPNCHAVMVPECEEED